jgi:Family of unknown function (DUF6056)
LSLFLLASTITFVAMYMALSFYNRFGFDDFIEILWNKQSGAIATITGSYMRCDGSILNAVLHQLTIPILFKLNAVFLFNYIAVLILYLSIYFAFYIINKKIFFFNSKPLVAGISGFFMVTFYYTAPHTIQGWYWASSMSLYLLPLILFFLCVGLFLDRKGKKTEYLLYLLFFIFCLSRVTVVLVFPAAFALYFAYCYLYKKKPEQIAVNLFIISCVGSAIIIAAPGNYARRSVELQFVSTDFSFTHSFIEAAKEIFKLLALRLRYYIALFIVFLWVGSNIDNNNTSSEGKKNAFPESHLGKTALIVIVMIILLFTYNSILMYMSLKQCFYSARVWTHCFLFMLMATGYLGIVAGYKYRKNITIFLYLSVLSCLYYSYANVKSISDILPYNRDYAKIYDLNIDLIKQAHNDNRKQILYCHPVPHCTGLIQAWKVEKDTAGWVNKAVAEIYDLKCGISDTTLIIGSRKR